MFRLVSLMFAVLLLLSGVAMASETMDGDKAMSQEDAVERCSQAGQKSGLEGEELDAYIESCMQQNTMSNDEGKENAESE